MKVLAFSNRWSISSSVALSFHVGLREATTPAIDIQGSNLGLMSVGKAEIPLSLASIPSMNFFVSASKRGDAVYLVETVKDDLYAWIFGGPS
jgi:hypothetical protein